MHILNKLWKVSFSKICFKARKNAYFLFFVTCLADSIFLNDFLRIENRNSEITLTCLLNEISKKYVATEAII